MATILNGQKILDGVFQGGSVTLPSIRFANSLNDGLYHIGANNIGLSLNGIKILDIATTGLTVGGAVSINDDVAFQAGTSQDAKILWETADANANALLLSLPEGGAVNVPVFAMGDTTALNKDLGLFNGVTAPTFAVLDGGATKAIYLQHDGTDGKLTSSSGLIKFSATGFEFNQYIDLTSAAPALSFSSGTFGQIKSSADDGLLIHLGTDGNANNNLIITAATNASKDHDHDTMSTNPTVFIHSSTDPDTSNNEWGSISHNTSDLVISTGAEVGTGTGATTRTNGLVIAGSTLTTANALDYGVHVTRTLNDSVAYSANEQFDLFKGTLTATATGGWKYTNLLTLYTGATMVFRVASTGLVTSNAGFTTPATTGSLGFYMGGGSEAMGWRPITDAGTNLSLGTDGYGNNVLNITAYTNIAKNHGQSTMLTDPTMRFYSSTDPTTVTQYTSLSQSTTAFNITAANQGAVAVAGLGINITAGSGGTSGNNAGGIISITGGAPGNSGTKGYVRIGDGTPTNLASLFDTESLFVDEYLEAGKSLAFGSDASYGGGQTMKIDTVQTTDATVTDISTVAVAEKETFLVTVEIVAAQSDDSQRAAYTLTALFYRATGGNVTKQGSTASLATIESDASWDALLTADTVNQTVDVQVIGKAGTTINWKAVVKSHKILNP